MMLRPLVQCSLALALACGPSVATDDGDGGASGDTSGPGDTGSSAGPTSTTEPVTSVGTSSTTTVSTSMGPSSDVDTGVVPECIDGTWTGLFSTGPESLLFESCDTGESWWFEDGAPYGMQCGGELWIVVEGQLCGPGSYGHLGGYTYELRGTVIDGPCAADCVGEPDPPSCGSFEDHCLGVECDVLVQDCELGDRCVPRSFGGIPPWTGSVCVPMLDPQPVGAPCEGAGPWDDYCDADGFCAIDPDDGTGTCIAICDVGAPACGDGEQCWACPTAPGSGLSPFGVCAVEPTAC